MTQIRTRESSPEITDLLVHCQAGDKEALDRLIPLVFEDLRRLARSFFAHQAPGHTLQPTAVIHEVYLRLVGRRISHIDNRKQFFAVASRLIRRILVDHARNRNAIKRGGGIPSLELNESIPSSAESALNVEGLLGLHQALEHLEGLDPRSARVVELRYFCGLKLPEVAQVLEVSLTTVERDWGFARRWLAKELGPS